MTNKCWCGRELLQRTELANRRGGYNFSFDHDELQYNVSVRTHKNVPMELFLNANKIDSAADLVARDAAIVLSIMLQFGIPLSVLAASALGRNVDGSPSSPIGKLIDILAQQEAKRGQQS